MRMVSQVTHDYCMNINVKLAFVKLFVSYIHIIQYVCFLILIYFNSKLTIASDAVKDLLTNKVLFNFRNSKCPLSLAAILDLRVGGHFGNTVILEC